jgi:hypothetical protein
MTARSVLTLVMTVALPLAASATCDKASECVFLVESKGPFDLKPVDAGKGPKK